MLPIEHRAMPAPSAMPLRSSAIMSLASRLEAAQALSGIASTGPGAASDAKTPEAPCEPDDPIAESPAGNLKWAMQLFKEQLMYGDEEESGVPPLSIEI